jgi:UDP-N-acetyl-2-amino-2-deoxyglucuronate dehydrogenase
MNVGPLQIAIIGCGWAGRQHARACAALGVQVRWAVDTNVARATALATLLPQTDHGLRTTSAYRDALADPHLDAVSICLPHNLHASVAIDAARAGVHVLVEKPLAANLDEADRMIAAADDAGIILMVAENVRFDAVYLKIRELLQEGTIGEPALLHMTRQCYLRESFLRDRRWFLDAEAAAGGIMMSGGIHDFETMRMLIGEVEQVYALRAPQRFPEMEGDDTSIAAIRFQNGAVGTLVESFVMKSLTTAAGPEVHTLRVDGELGHIAWEGGRTLRVFSEGSEWQIGGRLSEHEIDVPQADSFTALLAHLIHCIATGEEPITSGRSQRVPLACVMAAYESMSTGRPVRVL